MLPSFPIYFFLEFHQKILINPPKVIPEMDSSFKFKTIDNFFHPRSSSAISSFQGLLKSVCHDLSKYVLANYSKDSSKNICIYIFPNNLSRFLQEVLVQVPPGLNLQKFHHGFSRKCSENIFGNSRNLHDWFSRKLQHQFPNYTQRSCSKDLANNF